MKNIRSIFLAVLCIVFVGTMCACQKDNPASTGSEKGTSTSGKTTVMTGNQESTLGTTTVVDQPGEASSKVTDKTIDSSPTTKTPPVTKVAVEKALSAITSEDDAQLLNNPNRGWRSIIVYELNIGTIAGKGTFDNMVAYCEKLLKESAIPTHDPTCKVVMSYIWLSAYCDRDISAKGLMAVEAYFQAVLNRGMQAIVAFQYSDAYPDEIDDAEQKTMHRHIDQLAPIVKKWKKAIHTVRVSFAGAYGEWVEPYFPIDYPSLLDKVMTTLVPDDIYAQVRLPRYKNYAEGKSYYSKIGIHIDSFYGKVSNTDYGFDGCEAQDSTKAYWDQLKNEGAYTPQDGELFVQSAFNQSGRTVTAEHAILELSEHRFTTLSARNSYGEVGDRSSSVIGGWAKQPVTEKWCKENNIIYAPGWFKSSKGATVSRNGLDFVRDYLGYKIELRNLKVTGDSKPSAKINCDLSLVNYGFSAAFNMHSGFAILDSNNKVVSTVGAGNPEKWYSRNPDNYEDGKLLTHKLSASMKLPNKSGHYKLAFFLKNNANQFAKTGNKSQYVNGYQILHEFDI